MLKYDEKQHFRMKFTEPQSNFILSKSTYPCFCGGFGSGKSITMAACAVSDLIAHPGANVAIYSPTYDLLSLVAVPYVTEILAGMNLPFSHNIQKNIISVPGYGFMIFRSLSNPSRIVGYEVFRSHVDEIDTLPKKKAKQAWDKVIARNRQKKGNNRVAAYTTPEGFSFVYEQWEKKNIPGYELIKAPTYTNPHLPEDYIKNLKSTYSEELVDAYIEGNFTNLTSGSVYRHFCRKKNGTDEIAQKGETLHIGMDFNVLYGAAAICVIRDRKPVVVGEIWNAYDTDDQIRNLKEHWVEHPIIVYPDSTGDKRTSANTTESDIKKLKLAGYKIKVNNTNPPIKDRVASVNAQIMNGHGERFLRVNCEKAPNMANALEQQIYDDNGLPDKSSGVDHITDALGYFINFVFGLKRPTFNSSVVLGNF